MDESPGKATDWGIVILRVVVGGIFLANGLQRLSALDFQRGLELVERTASHLQTFDGALVTFTQCIGGAALVCGLRTRYAAALLAADVLLGIWVVDVSAATFLPSGGKFVLTLLGALIAIVWAGGGGFALDRVLEVRLRRPVVEDMDVAVRLEESRGKKLDRCVVTVRGRPSATGGPGKRAEIWHGKLSA